MKFSLSTAFVATKSFKLFYQGKEVVYAGEEESIQHGTLYYFKYPESDEHKICLYAEEVINEIQVEQIKSE